MVNDLNLAEHYAMRGLAVITPEQGMRFLSRVMGQSNAQAAVVTAEWPKLFEFQPKVSAMIAHLGLESAADANSAGDTTGEDFLEALLMAEPGEQGALIEQHLQSLAARVLRMGREKVDVSQPLNALGLDSMMATELKNRMELSLRIPISVLDLLKGASIADFTVSLLPRLIEENADIHELLQELERVPEPASLSVATGS
jgi:acyl carrier protein